MTLISGSFANAFNLPPDSLVTGISSILLGGGYEFLVCSLWFCYLPLLSIGCEKLDIPYAGELGFPSELSCKGPAINAFLPA